MFEKGVNMHKDKWKTIRDAIVRNCKIVFPILVIFIVAITVVIALNANRAEAQTQAEGHSDSQTEEQQSSLDSEEGASEESVTESRPSAEEVPLAANEDDAINTLVTTYYNAITVGDTDTLQTICHGISENNLLYYAEMSEYIDHYSDIEIYSKQGPAEGTAIVYVYYRMGLIDYGESPAYETLYVCTDEQGQLYIKDAGIFTEDEKEYIRTANEQVDVVEFNNRVNVEYNELLAENPELLEYINLLRAQLNTKVGEILASRAQEAEQQETEGQEGNAEGQDGQQTAEPSVESGPKYASATTTVNVRSSDSEQADKLGKVSGGTRLEVQEVRVNGWTKILYEGHDGYIKSEYLQFEENVAELEVIGTVTATTNVNIRAAASEDADRLGMLAGGSSLELLANENGWCKVNYNDQVGYVKADYVTQQ